MMMKIIKNAAPSKNGNRNQCMLPKHPNSRDRFLIGHRVCFFYNFLSNKYSLPATKTNATNFRVSNLPMIYLIYFSVVSGEKLGRSMSNKLLIFNYYGNSRWRHTKANIEIYSKAVGISINKTYTNKNWRHQIGWNWAVFFFI